MREFITIQEKPIMWEALPTIILKNYRDSAEMNSYTQCRICAVNNELYIRLFSFETTPPKTSEILLYLSINGSVIEFLLTPSGLNVRARKAGGKVVEGKKIKVSEIGGENNQGIFWGGEFSVSSDIIKDIFGIRSLLVGSVFKGEIVKRNSGENPHFGTLFAKDEKNFFEMMDFDGEFEVVGY